MKDLACLHFLVFVTISFLSMILGSSIYFLLAVFSSCLTNKVSVLIKGIQLPAFSAFSQALSVRHIWVLLTRAIPSMDKRPGEKTSHSQNSQEQTLSLNSQIILPLPF
jgi:hypothetical protein